MPELIRPHARVHRSFLTAVDELVADGRAVSGAMVHDWIELFADRWDTAAGFQEFVEYLDADARPETPRSGSRVPQTTLWLVEGEDYLGRISIRHELNDWLREVGGHIGYEVRPSARGHGYATQMLREVRPYAAELGIDPALLTCSWDNEASRRIIEKCGGVLEDRRGVKLRYWMPTGSDE